MFFLQLSFPFILLRITYHRRHFSSPTARSETNHFTAARHERAFRCRHWMLDLSIVASAPFRLRASRWSGPVLVWPPRNLGIELSFSVYFFLTLGVACEVTAYSFFGPDRVASYYVLYNKSPGAELPIRQLFVCRGLRGPTIRY